MSSELMRRVINRCAIPTALSLLEYLKNSQIFFSLQTHLHFILSDVHRVRKKSADNQPISMQNQLNSSFSSQASADSYFTFMTALTGGDGPTPTPHPPSLQNDDWYQRGPSENDLF